MTSDPKQKLFAAALQGNLQLLIETLDKQNVDVNTQDNEGTTALIFAAANNQYDCVVELLKRGASPAITRKSGTSAIFFASQGGFSSIIRLLLLNDCPVEQCHLKDHGTPLLSAAQNGHADCVELLLRYDAGINAQMKDGASPLFLAAQGGHLAVTDLLIQFGAAVDLGRKDRTTPLFIAAQMGYAEICLSLLEAGANVNASREDGATPLFKAAQKGHASVVEVLLNYRPSLDLLKNGDSALHAAALFGRAKVCHMLLLKGADPQLKNKDNLTPIDLAQEGSFDYLVSMMLNFSKRSTSASGSFTAPVSQHCSPPGSTHSSASDNLTPRPEMPRSISGGSFLLGDDVSAFHDYHKSQESTPVSSDMERQFYPPVKHSMNHPGTIEPPPSEFFYQPGRTPLLETPPNYAYPNGAPIIQGLSHYPPQMNYQMNAFNPNNSTRTSYSTPIPSQPNPQPSFSSRSLRPVMHGPPVRRFNQHRLTQPRRP